MSGKTTLAVKQDLFRIIARANLNQIISISTTTNQTKNINCKRKSDYQINRQQAYRKSKKIIEMIEKILYRKWLDKIKNFANELMRQLEIVRPNRKIPIARRYGGRPVNFMVYIPLLNDIDNSGLTIKHTKSVRLQC